MAKPHGTIRQSQIITTHGPGALVDLTDKSIIVGCIDDWGVPARDGFTPIEEPRLVARLNEVLEHRDVRLYAPPTEPDGVEEPTRGIRVWEFPQWFVAQWVSNWDGGAQARPLVQARSLRRGAYEFVPRGQSERARVPVVPMRFVRACARGHLSDIPWYEFVHGADSECRRRLWLVERSASGDLADTFVYCECGRSRSLASAKGKNALGECQGERPWFGTTDASQCGDGAKIPPNPNRLLLRHASNAYFPQVLRAISIPDQDTAVREAVNELWDDFFSTVKSLARVTEEREKKRVAARIGGMSDEAVWAEIERRRSNRVEAPKSIKQVEIEALLAQPESVGEDVPFGQFFARTVPAPVATDSPWRAMIHRVVAVHRLREVAVQVGFTRFEPTLADIDGELELGVETAPIAREATWRPATEIHGEGILLSFTSEAISEWRSRPAVQRRFEKLHDGFERWRTVHQRPSAKCPPPEYWMLHSLSHLLLTAVSLECGYAASSIRERVYAMESGYGILLYTGSPDSEGTLGGLAQIAQRMDTLIAMAIELGRLCSNDPVCAEHDPRSAVEERFLHGAACHGCLLVSETSCERRNEFLDRSLVVPTVGEPDAAFFNNTEE